MGGLQMLITFLGRFIVYKGGVYDLFINISVMYNLGVGQGGVYTYEVTRSLFKDGVLFMK